MDIWKLCTILLLSVICSAWAQSKLESGLDEVVKKAKEDVTRVLQTMHEVKDAQSSADKENNEWFAKLKVLQDPPKSIIEKIMYVGYVVNTTQSYDRLMTEHKKLNEDISRITIFIKSLISRLQLKQEHIELLDRFVDKFLALSNENVTEKKATFKAIENEFYDKLGNVTLSAPNVNP